MKDKRRLFEPGQAVPIPGRFLGNPDPDVNGYLCTGVKEEKRPVTENVEMVIEHYTLEPTAGLLKTPPRKEKVERGR